MLNRVSRRRFLQTSSLALAGAALPACLKGARKSGHPAHIGLQLYSLRDVIQNDTPGVVARVAEMGYREVEPYGFDAGHLFGMSYAEFGKLLQKNGLTMPSTHCSLGTQHYDAGSQSPTDAAKRLIDSAAGLGVRYLVAPSLSGTDMQNIGATTEAFRAIGAYCKSAGLMLGFHNHGAEFTSKGPDGRMIMEWLLQEVPADLLAIQMDIYWVKYAGQDPLKWFADYPGRWKLCHVKDMANTEKRETIEVGDGTIDFKSIFAKSDQAGFEHYVVELEHYVTDPISGVERARKNLLKLW